MHQSHSHLFWFFFCPFTIFLALEEEDDELVPNCTRKDLIGWFIAEIENVHRTRLHCIPKYKNIGQNKQHTDDLVIFNALLAVGNLNFVNFSQ